MANHDPFLYLLVCFLFVLVIVPVTTTKPTAYELLQSYNFPVGILPVGVTRYELDPTTGKFAAYMDNEPTCGFSLEGSYQLEYKSPIKGYISEGRLRGLEGVKVKIVLFWVSIVEVSRMKDGSGLEFSVGVASGNFPMENFLESPRCGCGLDCDVDKERKSLVGSY